jgi:hypothetical protein
MVFGGRQNTRRGDMKHEQLKFTKGFASSLFRVGDVTGAA